MRRDPFRPKVSFNNLQKERPLDSMCAPTQVHSRELSPAASKRLTQSSLGPRIGLHDKAVRDVLHLLLPVDEQGRSIVDLKDVSHAVHEASKRWLRNHAGYSGSGAQRTSAAAGRAGSSQASGGGGTGGRGGAAYPQGSGARKNWNRRSGDAPPGAPANASSHRPGPTFACPFCRYDPVLFDMCLSRSFSRINDVHQHLERSHRETNNCPRCRRIFTNDPNDEEFSSHIQAGDCRPHAGPRMPRRTINEQQWMQILLLRHQGLLGAQRWLRIWDILFIGVPHPTSIHYTGTGFSDRLNSLIELFEQEFRRQNPPLQQQSTIVLQVLPQILDAFRTFAAAPEQQQQQQRGLIPSPATLQLQPPTLAPNFQPQQSNQAQLPPQVPPPVWSPELQPSAATPAPVASNVINNALEAPSDFTYPAEPEPDHLLEFNQWLPEWLPEWADSQYFQE
ncbi:putative C2H2-type domain-containing protein [Seiridium cardinale]